MSGFLDITQILVPGALVSEAHAHLQEVGTRDFEGQALWAGRREGPAFHVSHTLIPAQTGFRTAGGVGVYVEAEELHRINVWLYQQQLSLIAQLHSHPGSAYHSDTDDAFPVATTVGCLSIVVPSFAQEPFALSACAVYRLRPGRGWASLTPAEAQQLITIIW